MKTVPLTEGDPEFIRLFPHGTPRDLDLCEENEEDDAEKEESE